MDWDIIGRYVLPSVLGIDIGLFSPWAGRGIDKRKLRLHQSMIYHFGIWEPDVEPGSLQRC